MKSISIISLSVALYLSLAGCSKHISGRYVCALDVIELKANETFSVTDAKSGATEMKGTYEIKGDRISFIPDKGRKLDGVLKGDSITIEGLPPLIKQSSVD